MIFPEIAVYIFNRSKLLDKDDALMGSFAKEFQSTLKDQKDFFERLHIDQINKIPTFFEFCRDDHQVPNEQAIKSYIEELKAKVLESPEVFDKRKYSGERKYKNESLSSNDLIDFTDKPTVEQIQGRVKTQKDFIEPETKIELSSQEKMRKASRVWHKVVVATNKYNKAKIESDNVREKLIRKVMALTNCGNKNEAENILDFTVEMMQRHSTILVNFPTKFLNDTDFQKHRLRTAFEGVGTRGGGYMKSRANIEDDLISHVSESLKDELQKNKLARPRYGQLLLLGNGQIPSESPRYGDSYMLLDEKLKLESTFTLGDTLNAQNLKASTIDSLELMLLDAGKLDFRDIIRWAREGKELDDIRHAKEYVEMQMPVIDVLDPNYVKNIFVNTRSKTLEKEILDGFENLGIPIDNSSQSKNIENRDEFFTMIKDPKTKEEDLNKMIKRYSYFPKLRDQNGLTTLELVAESGNKEIMNILVKELTGREIEGWKGRQLGVYEKHVFSRMMYYATQNQDPSLLKVLTDAIDINEVRDVNLNTPLMYAMMQQDEVATKKLLLSGADLEMIPRGHVLKYCKSANFKKLINTYEDLKEIAEEKMQKVLKDVKKGCDIEESVNKHFGVREGLGKQLKEFDIDAMDIKFSFIERFISLFVGKENIEIEKISKIITSGIIKESGFKSLVQDDLYQQLVAERGESLGRGK